MDCCGRVWLGCIRRGFLTDMHSDHTQHTMTRTWGEGLDGQPKPSQLGTTSCKAAPRQTQDPASEEVVTLSGPVKDAGTGR